jgi:hypothetical protein
MAIRRSLQGELDKRVAGGEARDDGLKKAYINNCFDKQEKVIRIQRFR